MSNPRQSQGVARLKIGARAVDLITAIPQLCPQIEELTFISYKPGLILEDRLKKSSNEAIQHSSKISQGLRERTQIDVPLSDLVIGSRLCAQDFRVLVRDLLYHRPEKHIGKVWNIPVKDVTIEKLQDMQRVAGKNGAVAIVSSVKLRTGEEAHLPLMDFRCARSAENLRKIVTLFSSRRTKLPNSGWILKSQRSYHFYGVSVLKSVEWLEFLSRCLLLGPLADSRYIAHCFLHGKSNLRITESPQHADVPRVCAMVGNPTAHSWKFGDRQGRSLS